MHRVEPFGLIYVAHSRVFSGLISVLLEFLFTHLTFSTFLVALFLGRSCQCDMFSALFEARLYQYILFWSQNKLTQNARWTIPSGKIGAGQKSRFPHIIFCDDFRKNVRTKKNVRMQKKIVWTQKIIVRTKTNKFRQNKHLKT